MNTKREKASIYIECAKPSGAAAVCGITPGGNPDVKASTDECSFCTLTGWIGPCRQLVAQTSHVRAAPLASIPCSLGAPLEYPCSEELVSPHFTPCGRTSMPPSPRRWCSTGFCCQKAGEIALDISEDPHETSVLVEAAKSGSGAMINAVVAAMFDLLTEERVGNTLRQQCLVFSC